MIYTGDQKLATCAKRNGVDATMTWELPLPLYATQGALDFSAVVSESDLVGSW